VTKSLVAQSFRLASPAPPGDDGDVGVWRTVDIPERQSFRLSERDGGREINVWWKAGGAGIERHHQRGIIRRGALIVRQVNGGMAVRAAQRAYRRNMAIS